MWVDALQSMGTVTYDFTTGQGQGTLAPSTGTAGDCTAATPVPPCIEPGGHELFSYGASGAGVVYTAPANAKPGSTDTVTVSVTFHPNSGPAGNSYVVGTAKAAVTVDMFGLTETFVPSPNGAAVYACSGVTQLGSLGPINTVSRFFPAAMTSNPSGYNARFYPLGVDNSSSGGDAVICEIPNMSSPTQPLFFELYIGMPTAAGTYGCELNDGSFGSLNLVNYSFDSPVGFPNSCSVTLTSFGTNVGDIISGTFTGSVWSVDLPCWEADTCSPSIPTCAPSATISGTFSLPVLPAVLPCESGTTQCGVNAIQTCSSTGQWTTTTTCPGICWHPAGTPVCAPAR